MVDINNKNEGNVTEVLRGGREVDVTFFDGGEDTVFVKELPWHKNEELAKMVTEKPIEVVMVATGIDREVLEKLDPDSFFDLHISAIEINMPNLNKWGKHMERVSKHPQIIEFQKGTGGLS